MPVKSVDQRHRHLQSAALRYLKSRLARCKSNGLDNRLEDIFDALFFKLIFAAESILMNGLSLWLALIFDDSVGLILEVIRKVFLVSGAA